MINKYSVMVMAGLISACATQGGWTPTVDPYGDPNAHQIQRNLEECRQLALSASGNTAANTAKGALIGGAIGAASGAALGALAGDAGAGAAIGATVGGFGGGAKEGFESEGQYKRAYVNCMRHRGHYVLD